MPNETPSPVAPRGTDRVRRRAEQAAHAEQAQKEAVDLQPLRGAEKAAKIAENKAKDTARFGTSAASRRQTLQAENRAKAAEQDSVLAAAPETPPNPLAGFTPGQQVDHRTARMLAKRGDRIEKNNIDRAARAAGLAVRDTLRGGKSPDAGRRTTARRIAEHNARNAAATKT